MSLYREYRPRTLDDVVGQEHIVGTLRSAIEQDQLSHAYLFAGTRGTGKTSTARILAKILLTRGIKDETLRKQIEDAVEEGTITDLTEIDAASNTGVDNIRDLIEKIQFTPVIASAKVYIIDEVHMLSKGAFNALLKTLEEPPSYAYFILATTELHKIPATIQSRCQRFLFRQINEDDIVGRLRFIADQEKITVDDGALHAIAHHVQGGMRDAISLLDQLRSLETITLADVKERVGETGHEHVQQILIALSQGDRSHVLAVVKELEGTGVPMENFARLMLDAVRADIHTAVKNQQSTAAQETMLDALLDALKHLRAAPLPGLVLESALLALCNPVGVSSVPPAQQTTPQVSQQPIPTAPPTPHISEPSVEKTSTPSTSSIPSTPSSPSASLESIRPQWNAIVDKVGPPSARMSLKNGRLHTIHDDEVTIRFSSSFHRDKASTPEAQRNLADQLKAITGKNIKMQFVLESDAGAPPPMAQEDSVDLASAAADIF